MAKILHVNPKGKWKKVDFSANNAIPGLGDLVSFEELTDYTILGSANLSENSKKKGKKEKKNRGTNCDKADVNKTIIKVDHLLENKGSKIQEKKTEKRKETFKSYVKKKKKNNVLSGKFIVTENMKIVDLDKEVNTSQSEADEKKNRNISSPKKRKLADSNAPKSKKLKVGINEKSEVVDEDMAAWKNLYVPPIVLQALKEENFLNPTPIQALALPHAIRDRLDIVGAAETGSGKTLAFGIPLIHKILKYTENQQSSLSADNNDKAKSGDSSDEDNENGQSDDVDDPPSDAEIPDDVDEPPIDAEIPDDVDYSALIPDEMKEEDNESDEEYDNPPDDENIPDVEGSGIGCVRVINDVAFDWLTTNKPATTKSSSDKPLLALILEPTRELAIQVKRHLQVAARHTNIKITTVVGGMAVQKQKRMLRRCPEIVVATPGRLWELIEEGDPHLQKVDTVQNLVIDEADRMIEKGHFEELTKLLFRINSSQAKKRRQTFVFSATLSFVHSGPDRVIKKKNKLAEKDKLDQLMKAIGIKEKPKILDLTTKTATAEMLTEARINCKAEEKDMYLYYFLRQYPGRTLVFANSKDCIRRMVSVFTLLGSNPYPLHADMHQKQRLKNLDRFSSHENALLLASDVAARGLDIPNVHHVIHYQVPKSVENYVHRSGRTARASKEGLSIMFVSPDDIRSYRKIINSVNKGDDVPVFPVEYDYISAIKERVGLAIEIDKEEHRFQKLKRQNDWYKRSAEELDIDIDDDMLRQDVGDSHEQNVMKSRIKQKKAALSRLLGQSVAPQSFSGKYPTKTGSLQQIKQAETVKEAISCLKNDKSDQKKMMKTIHEHSVKMNKRKMERIQEKKKKKWNKKKNKKNK